MSEKLDSTEIYHNIGLFNMCETGLPHKTIFELYEFCKHKEVSSETILNFSGHSPLTMEITKNLDLVNSPRLSVYALLAVGVNIFVIEEIRAKHTKIDDLANDFEFIQKLSIQEYTRTRIFGFVEGYIRIKNQVISPIESAIVNLLSEINGTVNTSLLWQKLISQYPQTKANEFNDVIKQLARKQIITIASLGIALKNEDITTFLAKSSNSLDLALHAYLKGNRSDTIEYINEVGIESFLNEIKHRIKSYPHFFEESLYREIFQKYDLLPFTRLRLGLNNDVLRKYIAIKYESIPDKNDYDYIIDNQLELSDLGKDVLKQYRKLFIGNEIVNVDVISVFKKFLKMRSIVKISMPKTEVEFRRFLLESKIKTDVLSFTSRQLIMRINQSDDFVRVEKDNYVFIDIDNYSNEFLLEITNYLMNFSGYGSIWYFLRINRELCKKNNIDTVEVLYSITKYLFEDEFVDNIEFMKCPYLCTKGLSKQSFIISIIEEAQPVSIGKFFAILDGRFGLSRDESGELFSKIIYNYKQTDGSLSVRSIKIDKHVLEVLRVVLNESIVMTTNFIFKSIEEAYGFTPKVDDLPIILKSIGYKYTSSAVYRSEYQSLDDAYRAYLDTQPMNISRTSLLKAIPVDKIENRFFNIFNECYYLAISDQTYINVNKRIDRKKVIDFRVKIESLISDEVVVLTEEMQKQDFLSIMSEDKEIMKLINALGHTLLESILLTSRVITCQRRATKFLLTRKISFGRLDIIRQLLKKQGRIERHDLEEELVVKYGYETSVTRGIVLEAGGYYNPDTDVIYDSKQSFDKELEEYLKYEVDS